jgi:hypothetical protein
MTRRNHYQDWVEPLQDAPDMVILTSLQSSAQQDTGIEREGGEA